MLKVTTTEHVLRTVLARVAGKGIDTIPEGGHLEQDLGIDSLALAELVTDLERRLTVVIPDEDTGRLKTVTDVRALLARLVPNGMDAR
ncbi:acyl carrier protein [Streptomyces sp. NPDC059874]|uniref:acyl carrier protein n=1 Tax=Streptomyces sp. NPDC059874 TaxID=3346983 RepID=UPI0036482AAA